MSLAIVFKGAEGIVLAADSRVTLTTELQPPELKAQGKSLLLPSTFDNATKLLKINDQDYIGVVTYGAGAIGVQTQRTAHSYMPEFEDQLRKGNTKRLDVQELATKFSEFFVKQWSEQMPKDYKGADMVFLVGGIDQTGIYGRVFEIGIPSRPQPKEWHEGSNFGAVWGGQREFTDRLIHGFDPNLPMLVKNTLKLNSEQENQLSEALKQLSATIPFPFLPLQDCVDLAIFLVRATITLQKWQVGIRGVGGSIDVATITQTDGFKYVQQKKIKGEISQ